MERLNRAMVWLAPLLALLLATFGNLEPGHPAVTRTAAVALLMALWWISGALPLAATSLVPLVLFPALGIMGASAVATQYVNDTVFLFIGGFLVALAMQHWDLHKRIALRLLLFFGVRPKAMLFGFMAPTFFISMWISNTATTMMMTPIALSVISRLEEKGTNPSLSRYATGLLLAMAYSSSIGGIATLIGTPPNLSFVRIMAINFPHAPQVTFTSWFLLCFPLSIALLFIQWALLSWMYCRRSEGLDFDPQVLRTQYRELGPITFEQKIIAAAFALMALLWLTRAGFDLGAVNIPGWVQLFSHPEYIQDGTVGIAIALLLFLIPSRRSDRRPILDWKIAEELPWDIVLLFGGGFALSAAFSASGLSAWVGEEMQVFSVYPHTVMIGVTTFAASMLTELTSNTAATEMLLPIMASIAVAIKLNPFFIMIPTTLACSFAFMLPVATPPNAIIYSTRRVTVWEMIKAGILLDLCAVVLVIIAITTYGAVIFHMNMNEFPDWAVLAPPVTKS